MKILVCGSRRWSRRDIMMRVFGEIAAKWPEATIISGGAKGADALAAELASIFDLKSVVMVAEWERFGRAAGPLRNRKMLDLAPDLVIAFHESIDESKGTQDCLREAIKRRIRTKLISDWESTGTVFSDATTEK